MICTYCGKENTGYRFANIKSVYCTNICALYLTIFKILNTVIAINSKNL